MKKQFSLKVSTTNDENNKAMTKAGSLSLIRRKCDKQSWLNLTLTHLEKADFFTCNYDIFYSISCKIICYFDFYDLKKCTKPKACNYELQRLIGRNRFNAAVSEMHTQKCSKGTNEFCFFPINGKTLVKRMEIEI